MICGWSARKTTNSTGEGVEKAQKIATILYTPNPRSLRSKDILPLTEEGSGMGDSIRRLNWKDVKGVTISKFAVVHGLCKSRGKFYSSGKVEI
jgi:hypothetical protein